MGSILIESAEERSQTVPRTKPLPDSTALKSDPVEFIRKVLKRPDGQPANPHPAQEVFLRNIRKLTVAPWGRQAGKSVGLAWYIAWYAVTKPNRKIYIIAPSLDQARIIFNEVSYHFQTTLKSLTSRKPIDFPFPKILLKNGSAIHARGSNSPQYIRGKDAHLIICDEAAFMKDKTITDVIQPMMTVTGKEPDAALILISTPFGEGAFKQFYDAAQEGQVEYQEGVTALGDRWCYGMSADASHFNFPSSSNPHADVKFLNEVKGRYGEDSLLWRTEYLAQFADDELAVFSSANIKWAYEHFPGFADETTDTYPMAPKTRHRYVQGADLANRSDYYVSVVYDVTDPSLVVFSKMARFRRRGWPAIRASIADLYKDYRARTLVDATTLAESVVSDLHADGIQVEGWTFTNASKYEIVHELARMLAEHRLVIPYDRDIIDELRYFEYDITPAKTVRMEAKRGHDDIVMAMSLAAHLSLLPSEIGFFQGVETFDPTFPQPPRDLLQPTRKVPPTSTKTPHEVWNLLFEDDADADQADESFADLWPD